MAKKNDQRIIISLIISLGLITAGILLFRQSAMNLFAKSGVNSNNPAGTSVTTNELRNQISAGEQSLLESNPNNFKQSATKAFANKNYAKAISQWSSSLKQQRNDPETLIYLNNARIGDAPSYSIAVPVPVDAEINVAKEILRGAAQAQQKVNEKGGLNGKPVKIIIANDRNNPQTARKLALNFSQNSQILGIVGHFSSNVTLEAAQIYQEKGLVVISPTSTSVGLSNAGSYVFRTVSSDCFAGNALVEYLTKNLQVKQTALLYNSASSYSTSMRDVFKSALSGKGGAVVAEFNFSEPNFSIVDALAKIKEKEAKALVLFPNSSGMNALETLDKTFLIAQINKRKLPLLGGDSLYKPRTLQLGQENMTDMVLAVPWHTKNTNLKFSNAAKKLWGGNVNWRTALTYDATIALTEAIKTNPSREGVQQALLSPDFFADGASGKIEFLPTGDRAASVELVKVVAGNNSGFGYDFVPVTNADYSAAGICK